MTQPSVSYFGPGLFGFLSELNANNDRTWFNANKRRYITEVEEPMLRFIADFGKQIKQINKNFVADPRRVGGSMFRIYRDTRFSKDKTPFKVSAAAQFPHQARSRDKSVPGFYLHLEPGLCIGGGGIYHPDAAALKQIRSYIVETRKAWDKVLEAKIPIDGDLLKRPPTGFDPKHRFVRDLQRRDYYSMVKFSEEQVCSAEFLDVYVKTCIHVSPLVAFLTQALQLQW
jgi:uncharacterized protein (TIGR02453 family)